MEAPTDIDKLSNLSDKSYSLIEEVLKHQPEEIKQKVRWLVEMSGLRQDDPLFLILLACRINHVLIENAPNDLENCFEINRKRTVEVLEKQRQEFGVAQQKQLERYQQAALDLAESKIRIAIAKILEDNGIENKKGKFTPRVMGSILASVTAAIALIVGFGAGWSFESAMLGKKNLVNLTASELNTLEWAKSKEGIFAKQILDWNEDLYNQHCQKNVRDLNVTIQIGMAKATSGYCWIWTVPPSDRTFVSY